jgi:hypothetical protein
LTYSQRNEDKEKKQKKKLEDGQKGYRLHSTRKTILSYDLEFLQQNMFVIPVSFAKEHKVMLAHAKELLEYQNDMVAINPRHNKLITSLRTAVENGEGMLKRLRVTMTYSMLSGCR